MIKNIILLMALAFGLLNAKAQKDTATFYPKALQLYDSAAWTASYGRANFNWEIGTRVGSSDLYSTAIPADNNNKISLELIFLDDSIVPPSQIIDKKKKDLENINNTFLIDSIQYKGFNLIAAREVPDECSGSSKNASNKIYVIGLKDVGEDFIYTCTYMLLESNIKNSYWEYAKMIADNCQVITIKEADEILKYPYTPEYAEAKLENDTKEIYQKEFSYLVEKRKCLSDYYLIEFMEDYYGKAAVEELVRTQSDSTIAKKYAEAKVKSYQERQGYKITQKVENGYTFDEVYALRRKIRNREIPLNDYFDFHNGGTKESALKRLNELGMLDVPEELSDGTVFKSRYLELIRKEIFKDTLNFWSADYLDKDGSFLLRISGRAQQVHEYMIEVKPNGNDFTAQLFSLPELSNEDAKFSWNFVRLEQHDYTILHNTEEETYYIQPNSTSNSEWIKVPLIEFGKTNIPLGKLIYMDNISDFSNDELLCNYAKWHGSRKLALDSMIVRLQMNYKMEEDNDKYVSYFMDDLAMETYKKELYAKNYWSDNSYFPLVINDTSYCDLDEYLPLMNQYLHPSEKIIFSEMYVQDLNGDSINDVFQFSVSNGKLVGYRFVTLENNTLKELKSKKIKKQIENFSDYINLKMESLKGNYYDDKTFETTYLKRVLSEEYSYPNF